mgnify:CR=1 FL=1
MSTEIIGYMTAPAMEQKRHTVARKKHKVKSQLIMQKLLGSVLIALGAATIPIENDATAFVMCLMIGMAAIIGEQKNG